MCIVKTRCHPPNPPNQVVAASDAPDTAMEDVVVYDEKLVLLKSDPFLILLRMVCVESTTFDSSQVVFQDVAMLE